MTLSSQISLISKLSDHAIEVNKTAKFMRLYAMQESAAAASNIDFVHGVFINNIDMKQKQITLVVRFAIFQESEGNAVWYRDAVVTIDEHGLVTNWRLSDDMREHEQDAPYKLGDKIYK